MRKMVFRIESENVDIILQHTKGPLYYMLLGKINNKIFGDDFKDRPHIMEMIKDIDSGEYEDGVSRKGASRDLIDALGCLFVEILDKQQVRVY